MRNPVLLAVCMLLLALGSGVAQESSVTRNHWVYEGGWFSQEKDGAWIELNEETFRLHGKPWRFKEVKRTKEYIELYDEKRAVTVRLLDTVMEARWDKDGKDAEWKLLYKGRWKKREE